MKKIVLSILTFYQKVLSRDQGILFFVLGGNKPTCIYYPTCSEYTKIAIFKHGIRRGTQLGFKRIMRCTPLHAPGVDMVPEVR